MVTTSESRLSTYRFGIVFQVQLGLSIYDSIHFVFTSNLKTNSEEDQRKLSPHTGAYKMYLFMVSRYKVY